MSVTRRQKEVVDFISNFVEENGYSPSFDEIARGLNLKSLATVHKHITNLQKKGLLERAHNRSRSIDILPPKSKARQPERLPLVGRHLTIPGWRGFPIAPQKNSQQDI